MKKRAVAIGTFDGVHTGHHALIKALKDKSKEWDLEPLIVTFPNHPLDLIAPHRAPHRICSTDEKIKRLRDKGVEVTLVDFNESTRSTTARQWIRILRDNMNAKALMIGYDNSFGCDGRGLTPQHFIKMAQEEGLEACVGPEIDGVSSSAVRKAVAAGKLKEASEMLGRPFSISGTVSHGKQLGRRLGFPTANITTFEKALLPPAGVYRAYAILPSGEIKKTMVNIGSRPTVDTNGDFSIEAHILDWSGDLYGQPLSLQIIDRIRDEKKFSDLGSLQAQLSRDAEFTRRLPDSAQSRV